MIFALLLNAVPIFLAIVLYFSISKGKIVNYFGLLVIQRASSPVQYWVSIAGMLFVEIISSSFAVYIDLVAISGTGAIFP
jgi:hypothetical protein